MERQEKTAAVEAILERAAEELGDITPQVMTDYFNRLPQAREMFAEHGGHQEESLQGEMVAQALYCLMYWYRSPAEIEILLRGSVPHHNDTLRVPPEYYGELLQVTAAVVEKSIPAQNIDELSLWGELRQKLAEQIRDSGEFSLRKL